MPNLNFFPPGTPPSPFPPPAAPSVKMGRIGVQWLPTLRGQNSYTGDRDGSSLDRDGSSLYRREIEDCHFAQVWVSRDNARLTRYLGINQSRVQFQPPTTHAKEMEWKGEKAQPAMAEKIMAEKTICFLSRTVREGPEQ